MSESDTTEKRMDVLLKTSEIMHKEELFDLQFYGFLSGLMHLKLKFLQQNIKQAIERWN